MLNHYIVDTSPGAADLATACGVTVPAFPIPSEDARICSDCLALVASGAVS